MQGLLGPSGGGLAKNVVKREARVVRNHLGDPSLPPLAATLQLALYRMVQELTPNVVKHARGATEASLELETIPGFVLLRVEHNGSGFPAFPRELSGLGLRSIRDRVSLLNGIIETGTMNAGGAYVRLRLPLPVAAFALTQV